MLIVASVLLGAAGCAANPSPLEGIPAAGRAQHRPADAPRDPFLEQGHPPPVAQLASYQEAVAEEKNSPKASGPALKVATAEGRLSPVVGRPASGVAVSSATPAGKNAHPTVAASAARGPAGSSPAAPPATGPQPLTLGDLEALALANNPTLARAAARVAAANSHAWQAGQWSNPVIGYLGTEIGDEGRAGQQGLFVEQEFPTSGKPRLDRGTALQAAQRLQHQLDAQRWRVLTDVRRQFFEVQAAQQQLDLSQRLVELADRWATAAQGLRKIGEFSEIELLQARIEADQARLNLGVAQQRHITSWRQLASLVGMPAPPEQATGASLPAPDGVPQAAGLCCGPQSGAYGPFVLPRLAPDPAFVNPAADARPRDWQSALDTLLASSPEMAAASARVEEARWALERARAEPWPDVRVQASAQYDDATRDTIAGLQAGVPLPLWHQFQGRIAQAEANLAAAQHNWQTMRLVLQRRLADAFQRYEVARQKTATYARDILPKSRQSLDLVEKAYAAKVGQFVTLLTAQRTYFTANLEYIEAVKELRQSETTIDGLALVDSLAADDSN
jgi:cobalt-zinc-cadmium efflux system outer membrane protein